MKKSLIAFLVAALCGAGAVFIFAQKGNRENLGGRGFGGRGLQRLAEKLNLSDEQKTEIETVLEDSRTSVRPLLDALRDSRRQAESLDTDGTFSDERINPIANSRAETTRQLVIAREKTKARIFAILTPEQRAEAVKIKERFSEKFNYKDKKRRGKSPENGAPEE